MLAYGDDEAALYRQAWDEASAEVKADTLVWVTITDGDDLPIYTNRY